MKQQRIQDGCSSDPLDQFGFDVKPYGHNYKGTHNLLEETSQNLLDSIIANVQVVCIDPHCLNPLDPHCQTKQQEESEGSLLADVMGKL